MSKLDDTIDILNDLVTFETVSSDSNLAIIDALANRLTDAGARVDIFHDKTGKKANLFASIGPDVDVGVVLSGHSDVVPAGGDGWANDPFGISAGDGKLYGRGT